jgi:hypothetical protein
MVQRFCVDLIFKEGVIFLNKGSILSGKKNEWVSRIVQNYVQKYEVGVESWQKEDVGP